MDLDLRNKVALIVGGADGIGAGVARTLYAEEASVVIADLNGDRAETLAKELGERAIGRRCDAGQRSDLVAAVDAAVARFGRLNILVQAVGLTLPDAIEAVTEADIEATFSLNMRSHLLAAQAAVPSMRRAGYGRLLFIGSGSGMKGSAGLSLYSASKFFLRGLMQALALELGPAGITANVVCPSDVYPAGDRPAGSWSNPKLVRISCEKEGVADLAGVQAARVRRTPLRRSCTVEDVADVVAFLASPRAGFITAQTIGLNGGLLPT